MSSLWIVMALLLVSTVQANAFEKSFGVSVNTFTTLPKITSLTQNNYVPNTAVVSVKLGLISGGGNFSTGITPGLTAFDPAGTKVFTRGLDNACSQESERIKTGEVKLFQEPHNSTTGISSIKMSARDGCTPKGEPVCVSSVVVLPSSGDKKVDPIYVSGNLLAECDATWYWGADSFDTVNDDCNKRSVREKCVWMSQVPQEYGTLKDVEISDTAAFLRENEQSFKPGCTSNLRLNFLNGTKMGHSQVAETTPTFDYVFYNSRDSATELCKSLSSFGPSFLSLKESTFCDMPTRQTFPMCNTEIVQRCVKRDGSLLTFIPRPSWTSPLSLARPMTLRPLGPLEAVNSTTGNQTNTAKDPSCQPIQRDKLFVGEKLWAGEHLVSSNRSTRLILHTNGEILTHYQEDASTYRLRNLSPTALNWTREFDPRSYYMELQEDGRICTQVWNTADRHCVGEVLPKDLYTLELNNNGFLYVKKPSGEAVQIDICPVMTSLKAGEKMTSSCLMSTDHSTFVTMSPQGSLILYKSRRYYVAEREPKTSYLELRRDGRLAICASNGTVTSVEFEGGLEEDDYIVYVTNEPLILIDGSNGKTRWKSTFVTKETPESIMLPMP
ncbi:hypothetical protein BGX31_008044 [Mortierella sp. GBA43]|nr:hypothetical protein BGX31_008044 [Mortierella sp. GBA43]